jgi:hypothetical protein
MTSRKIVQRHLIMRVWIDHIMRKCIFCRKFVTMVYEYNYWLFGHYPASCRLFKNILSETEASLRNVNLLYVSVISYHRPKCKVFILVFFLRVFYYNLFWPHAAIFRRKHFYYYCFTVILLIRVWNALLFLIKSLVIDFKVCKNPGNLLDVWTLKDFIKN